VETREWFNDLHAQRTANLPRIQNWSGQIALPPAEQYRIRLKATEGVHLMTALNDHRLMTAAQNDIGQEEMEMSLLLAFQRLTPAQHHARREIDFLAYMIEELLRLEPDDCTDWQKHASDL
jgi:hypothetical protein